MDHAPRRRFRVVAAGVVLVLILGATWVATLVDDRLLAAREGDVRAVVPAATRGDCVAAAAAYRGAMTGLLLPGRERPRVTADAARLVDQCREVTQADDLVAAGRHTQGLASYLEFRRTHVFSPLYEPVRRRIQGVVRAAALRPDAETCRLVAKAVGGDNLQGPVDAAPALLTACGELLAAAPRDTTGSGDRTAATVLLETVRTRHGTSPEARRAEAAEAALAVDSAAVRDTVVTPRRTGAGTGQARVVVTNAAREPLRLVVSGADAGRVLEIGACQGCSRVQAQREDADAVARCDTGKGRTAVVTLPPGTYLVHASRPALGRIERWTGAWKLRPGTYAPCF